ncbi:MAG: amidohydrolase [Lentisphaerae bacterium]|nr:amidohydrolase [Lentisphaerota bacterium]
MSSLLLKNVIHQQRPCDVHIVGNRIKSIAPTLKLSADQVIDGHGRLAVMPAFYNSHTHAAMTLLRGYADDLELFTWLSKYIWPAEERLSAEDIYAGSRLANLEMIKSGTVFYNDMYWLPTETARAVEEMGMRAMLGMLMICGEDGEVLPRNRKANQALLEKADELPGRIRISYAPHACYTVSEKILRRLADDAREKGRYVHIHAAESRREVEDCRNAHGGLSPIAYLDRLGVLSERCVLAHCVHLSEEDIAIIRERGAVISHMPASNMKLSSGNFNFQAVAEKGRCRVTIGTDGCASNNNLSMLEEMKLAALLAKACSSDPTVANDGLVYDMATRLAAEAFGLDAGVVAEGKLADLILVELDHPVMVGDYNLVANLVYAADTSVIHSVICDGRVLMENHYVPGEEEIIAKAREACRRIKP